MSVQDRKRRVAMLSIGSNLVLVVGKLVVGLMVGSVSIISEAIHSSMDLAAAVIAYFAVRIAGHPPDSQHPFGHGKFENASGVVEAALIFVAAILIIYEAVHKLLVPTPLEQVGWGVGVMLASAVMNQLVSHFLFKVGKETDSMALIADAWHLRTDVWTSAGVMGGLGIIWLGGRFLPGINLDLVDPIAAIAVALLILRAAWQLTRDSARGLVDESLPAEEQAFILDVIENRAAQVRSIHRLRTRKSGADRFVDFHVVVDPAMTVMAAHVIADDFTAVIKERFPSANVVVHIEPCDGSCSPACQSGCRFPLEERPLKVSRG